MRRFTVLGLHRQIFQRALMMFSALWLAGCQTPPAADPRVNLFGERVLVRFSESVELRGQTVLIESRDDGLSLSGYAGCNLFWGAANLDVDGRLSVGPLLTTRRACKEAGLSESEAAFVAALSDATFDIEHSGVELALSNGDVTLVFADVQ